MGATMARRRQKAANIKRAELARIKAASAPAQPEAPAAPEDCPAVVAVQEAPKVSGKPKWSKK